ncbi:MAG: transposase [Candidatus Thiodiazotropha sp. (ex Lucinoma aequizonata)]|nr:transposase [Candidatus Thiodiazotropha sp. (ex Lucinoma aequizonata)]MCU7887496.1 transposase [Candidatus Thiodiazotropha sp. (ex Lucinoma aequizonata)]MCU7894298.1 transposase [Candidatus Thiodiazotropha sp. (ex Lucinoma aequizonata)]MCU7899535.1 transposase [Candidatus Thiodiazotropha sp. (ex Lucinoma aequizonata)]MCU7901282.1 transposase [Candidatus Thiodiazotropha sp. (ex Lucinoma aequizonata)]
MTTRKKYSKEFKLDAISLVEEQDYATTEAASSIDICLELIRRWIRERQADDGQAFQACLRSRKRFWDIPVHQNRLDL